MSSPSTAAAPTGAPTPVPDHIPARMLNEYTYCPRLAYLMWNQQEWADSADTIEGRHAHRRVDRDSDSLARVHERSIHLTSDELGLTAVIDLIESRGKRVRPVDYKRGKRPAVPGGAYEPEKVQLCAQALLLREHGYQCAEGVLYYVASKQRVRVRFTQKLVDRTLALLKEMRERFAAGTIPPPLEDSPKCPRCSLVKICLPDEVNFLRGGGTVRRLAVADPATHPLVVQSPGARVRVSGERLVIEVPGEVRTYQRLAETSHVVLAGGASVTSPALRECCQRGLPIVHLSGTGWLYAITQGMIHKNVELRARQYAAAVDADLSLPVARTLVATKIRNARVLLRRNGKASKRDLALLSEFARRADKATDREVLLGIEGTASRVYFSQFASMLKGAAEGSEFDFNGRNKRPPRDPVNAMLSYAYGLLTKDWSVTLLTIGLDPLMGIYHVPRYGKPALALDMMEPFRPVVAESVVVAALNNGEVSDDEFIVTMGGVVMKPRARKSLTEAYERRMATEVTHPVFGYPCSYRRVFEIQARLFARYLLGELVEYPAFGTR